MGTRTSPTLLHAWFPSQSTGAADRAGCQSHGPVFFYPPTLWRQTPREPQQHPLRGLVAFPATLTFLTEPERCSAAGQAS
jgi:hypothetical protein